MSEIEDFGSGTHASIKMAETVLYSAMLNSALEHYDPEVRAPYPEADTLAVWLMQEDAETICRGIVSRLKKMGYSIQQTPECGPAYLQGDWVQSEILAKVQTYV